MKRLIMLGLGIAALAGFAGTCTITNISLTSIGGHKTYGGKLSNNSGANLLQHDIQVAFFNSSNQLVEQKVVAGCLRSLQNGSSDFFSATTSGDGSSVTAAISTLAYNSNLRAGTTVAGNLTISNVLVWRNGTTLNVSGTIKNLDTTTLTSPVACAVVYDSSGNVVIVQKDTTPSDLAQNASDTFSLSFTVQDSTTLVDHVDVWVDGLEGGVPVNPRSATGNAAPTVTPTPTVTSTPCACTATPTTTPTATATP